MAGFQVLCLGGTHLETPVAKLLNASCTGAVLLRGCCTVIACGLSVTVCLEAAALLLNPVIGLVCTVLVRRIQPSD